MEATLKQLRRATGEVIRAVGRGERVIVTDHGRPIAQITPVPTTRRTKDSELFGMWKDNEAVAPVKQYIDKIRRGRFA